MAALQWHHPQSCSTFWMPCSVHTWQHTSTPWNWSSWQEHIGFDTHKTVPQNTEGTSALAYIDVCWWPPHDTHFHTIHQSNPPSFTLFQPSFNSPWHEVLHHCPYLFWDCVVGTPAIRFTGRTHKNNCDIKIEQVLIHFMRCVISLQPKSHIEHPNCHCSLLILVFFNLLFHNIFELSNNLMPIILPSFNIPFLRQLFIHPTFLSLETLWLVVMLTCSVRKGISKATFETGEKKGICSWPTEAHETDDFESIKKFPCRKWSMGLTKRKLSAMLGLGRKWWNQKWKQPKKHSHNIFLYLSSRVQKRNGVFCVGLFQSSPWHDCIHNQIMWASARVPDGSMPAT